MLYPFQSTVHGLAVDFDRTGATKVLANDDDKDPIWFRNISFRQFLVVFISKCLALKRHFLTKKIFAFEMICVSILSIARKDNTYQVSKIITFRNSHP